MIKKTKKNKNLGFTLIEVLIASFVILIGVITSYIVVQQIFAQTFDASSRLTAIYLAQEGAEITRNIRDTGWINGLDWDTNGIGADNTYWEVEYLNLIPVSCPACNGTNNDFDTLTFLKIGPPFYNYSGGNESLFKRRIKIERPVAGPNSGAIIVTVDVMWRQRGNFRRVTIQSFLYDWKG